MRIFFVALISALLLTGCVENYGYDTEMQELLSAIDNEIANTAQRDTAKMQRLDSIKQVRAALPTDDYTSRYDINHRLFTEYASYICDSALHYANRNIELAALMGRHDLKALSILEKLGVMARAGLFKETMETLDTLRVADIPDNQRYKYYSFMKDINQFLYEYAADSEYGERYATLSELYNDSIMHSTGADPFEYVYQRGSYLIQEDKFKDAESYLHRHLDKVAMGTREYSVLASILAFAYQKDDNAPLRMRYMALSALSDMRADVKENMAIRSLAEILYEHGDVDRANRYLKQSIADANFFSARLRNNQSSKLLPIVDESYDAMQKRMQGTLKIYILAISILAVGLVVAILVIFRQFKSVSSSHKKVTAARNELAAVNQELSNINHELERTNSHLTESNIIKEEYVVQFMGLCSTYIFTLEQYRKSLRKLAVGGKTGELKHALEDSDTITALLKEFYAKFDTAFLNIFPAFIEQFNSLLPAEEQIEIKGDDKLNTELRIFALIRLGITDSAKIAKFLRCSVTTIYTYRSKMKNKSLYRDNFDAQVMKITPYNS
jgi:hypothetical protein